jgi:cell wall-associated NlpC family hydrolase
MRISLVLALSVCFFLSSRAGGFDPPFQKAINDSIVNFSRQHLGIKYKWAQSSPANGFDCSGFVYYVFRHFNIDVPRASMDYEKAGRIIPVDSCRPGDIIVFTGTNASIRRPGHVGIILSAPGEDVQFIHSSSGQKRNGVIISSFSESPAYRKRFIKIVRPNL